MLAPQARGSLADDARIRVSVPTHSTLPHVRSINAMYHLVIKAGEVHSFRCIGDSPLVQLDVHLSPRFIQENLVEPPPPGVATAP